MKKQLLASTALVAASLLVAGTEAYAQSAAFAQPGSVGPSSQNIPPYGASAPASSPPRFVIQFRGFVTGWVGGAWNDDVGATSVTGVSVTTGGNVTTPGSANNARAVNATVHSYSRLSLDAGINLDNGFNPGYFVEWDTSISNATNAIATRRAYAYVNSARFGILQIGDATASWGQMEYREPDIYRGHTAQWITSSVLAHAVLNPSGSGFGSSTMTGPDNGNLGSSRRTLIAYYTPRIEGFQLGAHFAPSVRQNYSVAANSIALENGSNAIARNEWGIAGNFVRTFDPGIVVRVSAGYSKAYAPDSAGFGSLSGQTGGTGVGGGGAAPDPSFLFVGGAVGYAGFSVGGSYGRQRGGRITGGPGVVTNSNLGAVGYPNNVVLDGYAWTLGATYQYGPWAVAVNYLRGYNSDCSTSALTAGACGSRDRMTAIGVNGSYQLGPGVYAELGFFHGKITGNQWNAGNWVGPGAAPASGTTVSVGATNANSANPQSNRFTGVFGGISVVF
ncbi:MAG: porin [Alphaproteobacteria bacterium]|nr:porin [Alphaproteobacteria bacterium]